MADNVLVDNGGGTDYTVSTDEAASGQVQRVKLSYSGDGLDTHVTADADGLLVNLGANNDVTVTNAINVSASVNVQNNGVFAVQASVVGSALTALEVLSSTVYVDDTGTHATGTSKVLLIGAAATPTDAAVNANDIGALSMTVNRELNVAQATATNLKTQAEAYQGGAAVAAGNPLQVTLANGAVPSHAVTNAGTFAVQASVVGSALTALEIISSAIYVDDTATHSTGTSKVFLLGAAATPTDAAVNANDIGAVAMTVNRELLVQASGQVKITDGTLTATVRDTGTSDSLNVAIVDGSGNQITSFGGGTQYTDDTSTHATGTSQGNLLMAAATPTDAAVDSNDIGAVKMSLNRELFVTMASVTPGTAAGNLGKAEDAGHATGDTGVMILGVVNSVNAAIADADLDYVPQSMDRQGNANVTPRAPLVRVSVDTSALTTSTTSYAAGDQVGGMIQLTNVARASGGGGYITGICLIDDADVIGAMDFVVFDASVSCAADNAAFTIADADATHVVGIAQLAGSYDIGANRVAQNMNMRMPYVCNGTNGLFGALITRTANSFFTTTSALTLIVYCEPS